MKIFINPGHMPNVDSGAVNEHLILRECDIALSIGILLAHKLKITGHKVKLLQSNNLCGESPDYPNICAIANNWQADIFISLHCNAFNTKARGTETLCYNKNSNAGALAQLIQLQLINSLQNFDAALPDRGIKQRPDLAVLRCTTMPAVLIEMAFIDNDNDAFWLINKQDTIAAAIARGITVYQSALQNQKPPII